MPPTKLFLWHFLELAAGCCGTFSFAFIASAQTAADASSPTPPLSAVLEREAKQSDEFVFHGAGDVNLLADGNISRGRRDVTKLTLRRGQAVILTARSKTMDTYLEVYGAVGDQKPIAADDDSGGGTDSQLRISQASDQPVGIYYVVVTSKGAGGDYQLEARKRDIRETRPISLQFGNIFSGRLDDHAPSRANDGLLHNAFTIVGARSDRISVSLGSNTQQSGRAVELQFNGKVLGTSDDSQRSGGSLIRSLPSDGTYGIDVFGDLNALGPYTIKVDRLPPAAAAPAPTPITAGSSVQGLLSSHSPVVTDQSNIPYDLYSISGSTNQRFRVTARSTADPISGDGKSGLQIQVGMPTAVGFATAASTADATRPVIFSFRDSGKIMIRVLGTVGQSTSYALRVDAAPPIP